MQYRIVEFQPSLTYEKRAFFVETGQRFWKKVWWFLHVPVINWTTVMDDDAPADKPRPLKYTTMQEALAAVAELKKMQPKYHRIV